MNVDGLLLAARQGDERAKQELARYLHAELIHYFACGHQEADAMDLAQRVLVLVLLKLDTFELREGQPLRNWVLGFAHREAKYARRQRGRDARLAAQHAAFHASPSPPTGPTTHLERKRQRERARRVIEQLETPLREAIQNDLERGTAETLAQRRGITIQHAYVLRSRARKKFHRLLERSERATAPDPTPPPT